MSNKPIFVATHPRACSTAFERVFMTSQDTLTCVHEPFGDAFYFGPERLSSRYGNDTQARKGSGCSESTYQTIFDQLEYAKKDGKRLFIKDMMHYFVPPEGKPATIAPSLVKKGVGTNDALTNGINGHTNKPPYPYHTAAEPGNPTVVPADILKQFHFTFLIRHPRHSIPSYYRCTIPPLSHTTGFYNFLPSEAGYDELRRVFDFLRSTSQVGPSVTTASPLKNTDTPPPTPTPTDDEVSITVIDADDMLDNPAGVIRAYCNAVGIEFKQEMLTWDTDDAHECARSAFEKWRGFHDDAINSTSLKPRVHKKKIPTVEAEDAEWREKYGDEGQRVIRESVDANLADYEYLKSFAIKV